MFVSGLQQHQTKLIAAVGLLLLLFLGLGCGFGASPDLQQEIRKFFYENQTDAGPLFVDWAEENLSQYSNRRIQDALHAEGEYHADLGHPNAISVISFAARDWAEEQGLPYEEREWRELQELALENLPADGEELKFWPD